MKKSPILKTLLVAFVCVTNPLLAQSNSRPQIEPVTLHGTVVDGVTGAPIAEAVVTGQSVSVKTDSSGRFVIPNFIAGEVFTFKSGYLPPEDIGKCCSRREVLFGGEQPGEVNFVLMPKAKIEGRVTLPSGAPLVSVHLTLLREEVSEDGLLVWNICGRAQTAADGSYRVSDLMPGSYRLRSDDLVPDLTANNRLFRTDANQIDGLPRSYFQGEQNAFQGDQNAFQGDQKAFQGDRNAPQAISLHAGDDRNVDLSITPAPFYRVVIAIGGPSIAGPPIAGPFGWTMRREDGTRVGLPAALISTKNELHFFAPPGRFRLDYSLYPKSDPNNGRLVAWADGSTASLQGSVAFEVRDQPVRVGGSNAEGPRAVTMHIAQHLTDPIQPIYRESIEVRDQDGHSYDAIFNSTLEDQPIKLGPLPPGRYRIAMLNGGSQYYTASLKCGGFDLLRELLEIDADQPPCTVEAELRNDFGGLTVGLDAAGTESLHSRPGEHFPIEPGLFAVASEGHLRFVRSNPDQPRFDGVTASVTYRGLPPGHYLASAFPLERTLMGRAFNEAATAEQLHRSGTSFEVKPGETTTVQLKGSLTPWR